jgi:hypothetical protein
MALAREQVRLLGPEARRVKSDAGQPQIEAGCVGLATDPRHARDGLPDDQRSVAVVAAFRSAI